MMKPVGRQGSEQREASVLQTGATQASNVATTSAAVGRSEIAVDAVSAPSQSRNLVVAGCVPAVSAESGAVEQRPTPGSSIASQHTEEVRPQIAVRPKILPNSKKPGKAEKVVAEATPVRISKPIVSTGSVYETDIPVTKETASCASVRKANVFSKELVDRGIKPVKQIGRQQPSKKNSPAESVQVAVITPRSCEVSRMRVPQVEDTLKTGRPDSVQNEALRSSGNISNAGFTQEKVLSEDARSARVAEHDWSRGRNQDAGSTNALLLGHSRPKAKTAQYASTVKVSGCARNTKKRSAAKCSPGMAASREARACLSVGPVRSNGAVQNNRAIRSKGLVVNDEAGQARGSAKSGGLTRAERSRREAGTPAGTAAIRETLPIRETVINRNAGAARQNTKLESGCVRPENVRAKGRTVHAAPAITTGGRGVVQATQRAEFRGLRDIGAQGDAARTGQPRQALVVEGTGDHLRRRTPVRNGVSWRFGHRGRYQRRTSTLVRGRRRNSARARSFSTNRLATWTRPRSSLKLAAPAVRSVSRRRVPRRNRNTVVRRHRTVRRRTAARAGSRVHRENTRTSNTRNQVSRQRASANGSRLGQTRGRTSRPTRGRSPWARWRPWGGRHRWRREFQQSVNTNSDNGSSSSTRARDGSCLRGGYFVSRDPFAEESESEACTDSEFSEDGYPERNSRHYTRRHEFTYYSDDDDDDEWQEEESGFGMPSSHRSRRDRLSFERCVYVRHNDPEEGCEREPQKSRRRVQSKLAKTKAAAESRDQSRKKSTHKRPDVVKRTEMRTRHSRTKTWEKNSKAKSKRLNVVSRVTKTKIGNVKRRATRTTKSPTGGTSTPDDKEPEKDLFKDGPDKEGKFAKGRAPHKTKQHGRNRTAAAAKKRKDRNRGKSVDDEDFGNTVDWTKSIKWTKATDWTTRGVKKSVVPDRVVSEESGGRRNLVRKKGKMKKKSEVDTNEADERDETDEAKRGSSGKSYSGETDDGEEAFLNTRGPVKGGARGRTKRDAVRSRRGSLISSRRHGTRKFSAVSPPSVRRRSTRRTSFSRRHTSSPRRFSVRQMSSFKRKSSIRRASFVGDECRGACRVVERLRCPSRHETPEGSLCLEPCDPSDKLRFPVTHKARKESRSHSKDEYCTGSLSKDSSGSSKGSSSSRETSMISKNSISCNEKNESPADSESSERTANDVF